MDTNRKQCNGRIRTNSSMGYKSQIAPKALTPGTKEWLASSITFLQHWNPKVEHDCRPLDELCGQLIQLESWKKHGYDNWDSFCTNELDADPRFINKIREGVRILEERGHKGPIPTETALGAHGGDRKSEAFEDQDSGRSLIKAGNNKVYNEARLKRDRPDLLEKVQQGELTANAAAIEAGFRQDRSLYITNDPRKLADRLKEKCSGEYLESLIQHLQAEKMEIKSHIPK